MSKPREPKSYNPLAKKNLAVSVAKALLERPVASFPPQPFIGAGTYAIYYTGNFEPYGPIAAKNKDGAFQLPMYVGKATAPGRRKGGWNLKPYSGKALYNRLREHARTIEAAGNLDVEDFCCRYLVVDAVWIPLAESLIIHRFSPLWNQLLDGFGNHDPGSGRHNQRRSNWDVFHPGRRWAENLSPGKSSVDELRVQLDAYVAELHEMPLKLPALSGDE